MIIIAKNYGQLGNRLFLFAHLIAAAREYETKLSNPSFAEYAHLFPSTAGDLWCRYPNEGEAVGKPERQDRRRKFFSKVTYVATKSLAVMGVNRLPLPGLPIQIIRLQPEQECDLGSDTFASSTRSHHLLLQGWMFRSERLLQKHAAEVRAHFEIQSENRRNVEQVVQRLRGEADVMVGVHIRHGDYATFMDGRYFFSVDQYVDAMRKIVAQLPGKRVAFLVCSNAKTKASDFAGLNVHFGPGHITEDMYAMAEADLLIGPPSTYTGWASFYGDVPLVVLKQADQSIDLASVTISNARLQPAGAA
ncbi:MAG: hypothetical protein AB8B91_24725 [Rubripirellula sp.]